MINYLKTLNSNQYQAVTTNQQYVRIIAGAGSGKTRVLTYRIAYLIEELGVNPWNILAFTFTNKVAKEMKERAVKLVDVPSSQLLISTFHSFCALFLRREISVLNFPSNYCIIDDQDQEKIIKDIAVSHGFLKSDKIVGLALQYISMKKCKGIYPGDITIKKLTFPQEDLCLKFFYEYEHIKAKNYSLDFDDLLLKTIQILEEFPEVKAKINAQYRHILIDEFQDTNDVQFKLVKLLMSPETSLYVVGDPDQTIYTWRGANQDIILKFNDNFPAVITIILDENYRSTCCILGHANNLISRNRMRVSKDLVTNNEKGQDVILYKGTSQKNEAKWVADQIEKIKASHDDFTYGDVAVLYRSNFLSMEIETVLTQRRIPNAVYGGIRFYQRTEIKDLLAYFRLINNPNDDLSFYRIINIPRRGIGEVTINYLKEETAKYDVSLYTYIKNINLYDSQLRLKFTSSLTTLIKLIDEVRETLDEKLEAPVAILNDFVDAISYTSYLSMLDDGEDRIQNTKALLQNIGDYFKEDESYTLDSYLQNVALFNAQDEIKDEPKVKLMTIHSAKGLEFNYVFIIGLNENVFPSYRAILDSGNIGLEEERRLCYVAITRAKKQLFVSYNSDYSFVYQTNLSPSRFIREANFKEPVIIKNEPVSSYRTTYQKQNAANEERVRMLSNLNNSNAIKWVVGDTVIHKIFGNGIVEEIKGDLIIVNFEKHGIKKILGTHSSVSKGN